MAKVIAIMNEKGGVGKSATATTLAYLLAKRGKGTALIDFDGHGHSSIIYGVKNINKLEITINTLLRKIMEDEPLPESESYVIKHESGVEVIPSNSQLFTLERNLCNVDFRERILSQYVDTIRDRYQYVIIDCMPQMGTPMINVMMCADSIIVPTQAELKKQAYASTLKSRALSVLIYLIDRSNKELTCFPAIPTMAEQLHISVSTVKRALHELLDSGYVKKDARFREKNKGQTSNLYTLVLFENAETPDGGDGFDSKDCAEESGLAEVKQEKAEEAGQETCQVKYISFETLKRQKEEVEEPQKAEVQTPTGAMFVEECPESQRENEMCGSCDPVQVIRQFFSLRNGDRGFSLMWQDNEGTMQVVFSDRPYRLLLYLWTGAGVSLIPP